jgi:GT2 family glycosyltransferase
MFHPPRTVPRMRADNHQISVVLATRNRADDVKEAVRTILSNDHPDFEVIVVDQSDDDLTEESLDPFAGHSRLHYFRTTRKGRSPGLNAGIREAGGALVIMTDDDCTVSSDWVRRFEAAFAEEPEIGVVFGNVVPARHDSAAGCIPAYIRTTPFLARSLGDKWRVEGIGACMGVRRSVWQSLGGFDEMLGSGAPFMAGEDGDLALRALMAGHSIYETPAVEVEHHGMREWEQLPGLIDSYWHGTGAMLAKPLRLGQWRIILLLLRLAIRWVFGRSPVAASLGSRPERLRKLRAFCAGFLAGAACGIDRQTGLYAQPAGASEELAGTALRRR